MIIEHEQIFDLAGNDYLKLFRINYRGQRVYIRTEPFKYYSGLTGALGAATFKGDQENKRITSWRERMIESFGKRQADQYLKATADFGTLLHECLVRIKENKELNWNDETELATEYFKTLFPDVDDVLIDSMVYDYQKHAASLAQFVYERVETIYAIETPVTWEDLNIATPVDLVCKCRPTPKGDFVDMVINVKTSSQVTDSHLDQVACEAHMWNMTYDNEVEYAAILRTKDWREDKAPTYDFKYMGFEDILERSGQCFNRLHLCLNSKSSYYPDPVSKRFSGVMKIGEKPEIIIQGIETDWSQYWQEQREGLING